MQLSSDKDKKRRGRQRLLTQEQIIATAKAIISDPQVEFSMRELGARLGVPHKTIYNYFESRELLLKHVLAQVIQSIPQLSNDSPLSIREQLRNELRGWRELMVYYAPLLESRAKVGPAAGNNETLNLAQFGPSIQVLTDHGVPPFKAFLVYTTLINWVLSMSKSMTSRGNWDFDYRTLRDKEILKGYPAMFAAFNSEDFPKSGNDYFEASVELLLDGLLVELR